MRTLLLAFALALPLPSLAETHDHDAPHLTEIAGLRALHAWTRATSGREALVFVELENTGGGSVLLTGAESGIASDGTLVGFVLKDGQPAWETLASVPLAAGRALHLEPGALAIRLSGLSRALTEGEHFDLHLETDHGALALHVEVAAADARQHSHAGHSH
ncbi:copper chaperone PCu(A)C [Salipiger bermudensis]|uniref:copper chaperone PCu(A)C n=1 Tax=Salipiger bermudensis TaxID=344736 RepID=UPI003009C723